METQPSVNGVILQRTVLLFFSKMQNHSNNADKASQVEATAQQQAIYGKNVDMDTRLVVRPKSLPYNNKKICHMAYFLIEQEDLPLRTMQALSSMLMLKEGLHLLEQLHIAKFAFAYGEMQLQARQPDGTLASCEPPYYYYKLRNVPDEVNSPVLFKMEELRQVMKQIHESQQTPAFLLIRAYLLKLAPNSTAQDARTLFDLIEFLHFFDTRWKV